MVPICTYDKILLQPPSWRAKCKYTYQRTTKKETFALTRTRLIRVVLSYTALYIYSGTLWCIHTKKSRKTKLAAIVFMSNRGKKLQVFWPFFSACFPSLSYLQQMETHKREQYTHTHCYFKTKLSLSFQYFREENLRDKQGFPFIFAHNFKS